MDKDKDKVKIVKDFFVYDLVWMIKKFSSFNDQEMQGDASCINVLCEIETARELINLAIDGIKQKFTIQYSLNKDTK